MNEIYKFFLSFMSVFALTSRDVFNCAPVWCRSAHTRLIEPAINDAFSRHDANGSCFFYVEEHPSDDLNEFPVFGSLKEDKKVTLSP